MKVELDKVTLFPKKTSVLGMVLFLFLFSISTSIIYMMWDSLKKIDEQHFPMIERSAINVRLVNLINYQFKIATEQKNKSVVQDLKINFTSLEQNYMSLNETIKISISESQRLFEDGNKIISLLTDKEWQQANNYIKRSNFIQQLEEFSFAIFDSTENLAEQRDKNSAMILKRIRQTVIISIVTIIFLIFLIRKIYSGYSVNLDKRIVAEKMALTLSKQRETLIHVLCHDLGNPVSAIFGLTEAAHLLDENAKANILDTIKENARESLDIIELTRKMQALESGKLDMEIREISILSAFEKSLRMLEQKVKGKNISVSLDIDPELKVKAEETSLVNSVLNNILTNSIKFSEHDGIIEISSRVENGKKEVTVSDKGIGIPKDILAVLFSETEQTSRAGTDGEIGTGFGMPLVKKFMNSYGGEIIVESSTETAESGTRTTLCFV